MRKLVISLGMVAMLSGSAFAWGRLEQHAYCTRTNGDLAMCAPGDIAVGGGGKCPGDPATLNTSRPVTVNGLKGWRAVCLDTSGNHMPTISTDVCCLHETCTPLDEATCHVAGSEVEGSEQ